MHGATVLEGVDLSVNVIELPVELIIGHDRAGSPATPCWAALAAAILALKQSGGRRRGLSPGSNPLAFGPECCILNQVVQYTQARLDDSFAALSDATRRGILEQLGSSDASITQLADKFHMTLTGIKKHIGVLEEAGLVTSEKVGRVRTCKLGPRRMEEETAWLEKYRQLWDARFEELDKVVEELERKEKVDGRKKRK